MTSEPGGGKVLRPEQHGVPCEPGLCEGQDPLPAGVGVAFNETIRLTRHARGISFACPEDWRGDPMRGIWTGRSRDALLARLLYRARAEAGPRSLEAR